MKTVVLIIKCVLPEEPYWGWSDYLDMMGPDATPEEIRAGILEIINEDTWAAIDPDDGAEWTITIEDVE